MRNGRMIILVDAEDRENEGDLVIPAQMATPDAINFMAKHGRGLICLPLTQRARSTSCGSKRMARHNEARNRTAFTVSIEAREGIATGISAHDRARTIATAIDPTKDPADIVSPGHVFPLIAREGGVLVRAGHTEASRRSRAAGRPLSGRRHLRDHERRRHHGAHAGPRRLRPAARPQDRHHRGPDRLPAAPRPHRQARSAEDHGRQRASAAASSCTSTRPTVEPVEHLALVKGDLAAPGPVLVRVHAVNVLADLLGVGAEGTRDSLIEKAMQMIEAEGRGVIVLIRDLRPKSCRRGSRRTRRARAVEEKVAAERRLVEIGVGSQILRDLGVSDMVLLTNAPAIALCRPRGVRAAASSASAGDLKTMAGRSTRSDGQRCSRPARRRSGAHILIIEARYYENISDELAAGAIAELEATGASYERIVVPGALEIPQALAQAAAAGIDPAIGAVVALRRLRSPSAALSAAKPRTTTSSATTPITG